MSRRRLGEYFGSQDKLAVQVLSFYLAHFDWEGLEFEAALRQLVRKVAPPAMGSPPRMLDQIMDEFGKVYHKSNPTNFQVRESRRLRVKTAALTPPPPL